MHHIYHRVIINLGGQQPHQYKLGEHWARASEQSGFLLYCTVAVLRRGLLSTLRFGSYVTGSFLPSRPVGDERARRAGAFSTQHGLADGRRAAYAVVATDIQNVNEHYYHAETQRIVGSESVLRMSILLTTALLE